MTAPETLSRNTFARHPPALALGPLAARVAVLAVALALGACAGTGSSRQGELDGAEGVEDAEGSDADGVPVVATPSDVDGVPGERRSGDEGPGDETEGAARPTDGPPMLAPALDADRDRVADVLDDCPDSAADEIVDRTGCPLFTRVLDGVVFAPNDHRLGAASRLVLAGLVDDLEAHPDVVVRLEGHTDNRGTAAANLELSKRRVMSVARFLVARGIAPSRLRPYGFGESRPRAGNATAPGRERNRRIEIGFERRGAIEPEPDPPPGSL